MRDFSQVRGELKEVKDNMQSTSGKVNHYDSKVESNDKILSDIPEKIREEVRHQVKEYSYEIEYGIMIGMAFKKYLNLIIDGIAEDPPRVRAVRKKT